MALDRTIKIKVDSSGAKRKVDSLDNSMKGLGNSADKTNQSFGKMKAAVIAVAAALQTKIIISYSDSWKRTTNVLASSLSATQNLVKAQADVIQISNDARAPLEQTAKLYAGISASANELNASQSDIAKFTELAAKSLAVAGSSAQESAGALLQLKQAIGGTVIQAQEFNSLIDGARPLLEAVAKGSDRFGGSVNKLREQVKLGAVTSKEFFEAALKGSDLIDKRFNKTLATFAQNMTLADNAATRFIGTSDSMSSAIGGAGEIIVLLADNLSTIANIALVAVVGGMSKMTIGAISSTAALVTNTLAAEAQAAAALVAARNQQVAALAMFKAATGATKGSIATNQLAKANIALAAASKVAAGGVTLVSRAISFLGGPVGILLTAASAIAIFATNTEDAKEKLEDFNKAAIKSGFLSVKLTSEDLDKTLTKQQGLDKVNLAIKLTERNLRKANKTLIATQKNFDRGAAPLNFVEQSKIQVSDLQEKLKGLKSQLSQIQGGALDAPKTKKEEAQDNKNIEFINNERFKTASLRAQLNERQAINRAFNDTALSEFASMADQERAITEFNRQADLAALETDKTNSALDFEQRREAILTNDRLTSEARLALGAELELQELDQKRIFEMEKTNIEADAAAQRAAIARQESQDKINNTVSFTQNALKFEAAFASKSEKAQKTRRKIQVGIDTAAGIQRAYAEHDFYSATGIALAIAASGKEQIDAINSGGGSSVGGGSPNVSQEQSAPRQEPIQNQNVLEFRGLSEVAELLANLDPDEVLPVEYTQRIVASLDEFQRISGGG